MLNIFRYLMTIYISKSKFKNKINRKEYKILLGKKHVIFMYF